MKKIKIDFPDARQIEINGHLFDVRMSDFEAVEMAVDLLERLSSAGAVDGSGKLDYKGIVSLIRETLDIIDRILGKGAMTKILDGRTADLDFMFNSVVAPILSVIVGESAEVYANGIDERYE